MRGKVLSAQAHSHDISNSPGKVHTDDLLAHLGA
jgi:hypothetical protein